MHAYIPISVGYLIAHGNYIYIAILNSIYQKILIYPRHLTSFHTIYIYINIYNNIHIFNKWHTYIYIYIIHIYIYIFNPWSIQLYKGPLNNNNDICNNNTLANNNNSNICNNNTLAILIIF